MKAQPKPEPVLVPARRLLEENREAEAAALLEQHPGPEARALHRKIAIRAATGALQGHEMPTVIGWLDRGLRLAPADPVLNFFRGNLYQDSGHIPEAVACFRWAFAADPTREEFATNLASVLIESGAVDEAVSILQPFSRSARAQTNLGVAYSKLGDLSRSAEAYEAAVHLEPALFPAWLNLGGVRDRLDDAHGALQAYNRAVALQPTSARAHLERGHVFSRLKMFPEAVASFDRSLALEPGNREALIAVAKARTRLCDWTGLADLRPQAIEPALALRDGPSILNPFDLLSLPGVLDQRELLPVAKRRITRLAPASRPLGEPGRRIQNRPLRVGYLSPDFENHAVGNCVRTLFTHHDRGRFRIHGLSLSTHPEDDVRRSIRAGCDTWDELGRLSDAEAVQLLRQRELDILVDLAGHTKGNRIQLLAARPAPIQVAWLGYPGTTGAPFIDDLLADEYLIPPAEEAAFSERIVRLPGSYLPTDDSIAPLGPESRAENGLPASGFVFCAFNNAYKIEPFVFDAWMEILRRTPGSWLWLRSAGPEADANLRREADAREVDPARLLFDPRSLPRAAHLARHRAADLYLDTHFYNAHSTAADALRAGLPVLTLPGVSFPSRVGLSLVSTLGLADELVATSRDDYIARAVRIGTAPEFLASIRERLAAAVVRPGGLFDTAAFARKLEDTFERLCR